jgi:hypothetical protein
VIPPNIQPESLVIFSLILDVYVIGSTAYWVMIVQHTARQLHYVLMVKAYIVKILIREEISATAGVAW